METRREEEDAEENDMEQEVVQMKFVAQLGSLYSKAANLSKETNSSSTFKDGEEISIALSEEERRVKQIKEGLDDEDGAVKGEEERIAASVALSFARQRGKNSDNNSSKQKSNALPIADISDCWTNKSLW